MASFYDYLNSEAAAAFGGPRLAHLLSPFATGSSRFLMQGSSVSLFDSDFPLVSFNLRNLSNRLKPVATSICAEVVWSLATTNPKPRFLVVDECWTVLATPSGAESLLTIARRARKYGLALISITQDVQDLLSDDQQGGIVGHAGRSLLQNSATKLALQQDAACLHLVGDALGLGEEMRAFLEKSRRGQGILVGSHGDCYPIEIVSTHQERSILEDRSWISMGDDEALSSVDAEEGEPAPEALRVVEARQAVAAGAAIFAKSVMER